MGNSNFINNMQLDLLYSNPNIIYFYNEETSDEISNNGRKIIRDLISVMGENNLAIGLENSDSFKTTLNNITIIKSIINGFC